MATRTTDRCPVCEMKVSNTDYVKEHIGLYYYFCSQQCLDAFSDRPILYIKRNKLEPIIKNRILTLSHTIDKDTGNIIQTELDTLMGITNIEFDKDKLILSYDLLQTTEKQIEKHLFAIGASLSKNWFDRIQRAWVQETEDNELNNLAESPANCCNRSPSRK